MRNSQVSHLKNRSKGRLQSPKVKTTKMWNGLKTDFTSFYPDPLLQVAVCKDISSRVRNAWVQFLAVPTNHGVTSPLGNPKKIAVHTGTCWLLKNYRLSYHPSNFLPDHKYKFQGEACLPGSPICLPGTLAGSSSGIALALLALRFLLASRSANICALRISNWDLSSAWKEGWCEHGTGQEALTHVTGQGPNSKGKATHCHLSLFLGILHKFLPLLLSS